MAYQPKSYKKFVATAATATLVASAVVPVAFAAKPATEFSDVAPSYKDAVDYLVDNTIAAGKTPSTFGTAEPIIRVDAAIWIAKATLTEGEISAAPASNFTDVPDRGKIYVDALKSKGYVNGSSATAFNSYANISRGEVALILAEAYDIEGNTANNKFTDVNSRYLAAVSALKDNGITSGKSSTRFGTGDAITRGELAIWVYKLETLDAVTVSNLNVAVNGSKATVTADVKNVEENTDATVSVYPNGNLSATPIVKTVKVIGGKLTTDFSDVPAGTHSVVVKVGEVSSSASFTIAAPTVTEVASVNVMDAKTIEVKFNNALNRASAETEANYTVAAGRTVSDASLSADGKTVTLSLADGTLLANDTQYTLTVDKDILDASGKAFSDKDFVTTILFNDETAPTVSSVSTPNGNLRVALSEKIADPTNTDQIVVVVNGQSITLDSSKAAWVTGNVISIPKASLPTVESGKSYSIAIAGAKDLAGNEMTLYASNFTYQSVTDTSAPTFSSITADGETTAVLTFSEELTATNASELGLVVKKNGVTLTGATASTEDGVNYEVDLSGTNPAIFEGSATESTLEFTVSGFKDLGNNLAGTSTKSLKLVKDTVAPTLSSTTYNSTSGNVVLAFSENIVQNGAIAGNVTIINNSNSQVVATPVGTAVSGKTISIPGLAAGSYTIYVNAGAVTDTSIEENANASISTSVSVSNVVNKPTVTSATATNDVITVNYSAPVKGGTGNTSASNVANYKLDGQSLPTGTLITLDGSSDTATITMPAGSIATSRTGILTVSNVEGANGAVSDTTNHLVALTDTKKPELASAKVAGTELVLTFSENVTANLDFSDFVVKVNGIDVTETNGTSTVNANQFALAVDASVATGTITVSVANNANAADAAGNVIVTGKTVTATR
jgi:hypothetical protein